MNTLGEDLIGYGAQPPVAAWPDGARVAVSVVINVEEGSEHRVSRGDPVNERFYDMIGNVEGAPDPAMESHFAYGLRAGYWRIMRLLDEWRVPATVSACAEALELSPWLAADAFWRGHEIACHGWRWQGHAGMSEEDERDVIRHSVATITRIVGRRPVGWHTRTPSTPSTRRLLIEEGGFLYDSDAYDDDLPYLVPGPGRPHVVLPYSLDTNDMRFQHPGSTFVRARDFSDYVIDAFDWLWREGLESPKMMSLGLHLRIIGRPARIGALEAVLRHMRGRGGVWFARRDAIAHHWLARFRET